MKKKSSFIQMFIASLLIIISLEIMYLFHQRQAKINLQAQDAKVTLVKKQKELKETPEKVNQELLKTKKSKGQKQVVEQAQVRKNAQEMVKHLYNIYPDQTKKSWNARHKNLEKFATGEALKNSQMDYDFQKPSRYSDQTLVVNQTKVGTSNIKNDICTGLIYVDYGISPTVNTGMCYTFKYDVKSNKFTDLVPQGMPISDQD